MDIKKSFDRFFVFALALLTALYFFGAKPHPRNIPDQSAVKVDSGVERMLPSDEDQSLPPVDQQSTEEPAAEDDKPADSDKTSQVEVIAGEAKQDRVETAGGAENNSAKNTYHCPMHIRMRAILI